jgi:hypothetical protein
MPTPSVFEQLRLVQQWMPLLGFGQRWLSETDPHRRALVAVDAAEWLASKTENRLDDQLVRRVEDILKTPQGEALVRDLVALGETVSAAAPMGVQP